MEIGKVYQKALILDDKDIDNLKSIVSYCKHRITKHPDSGIHRTGVTEEFVSELKDLLFEM